MACNAVMSRPVSALLALLVFALPTVAQNRAAPVTVVRDFLAAVQRGDCDRAWSYFSAESRAYIEGKSREMIAAQPYYAEVFAPRQLYCRPTSVHRFHSLRPKTATLAAQNAGRATVRLDRHEGDGFLLPGFWSTRTKVSAAEIELVEKAGTWKVVAPRSASGPAGRLRPPDAPRN